MNELDLYSLIDYKKTLDAHAIVAETDRRGSISYVNEKFCQLSGFTKEELLGNSHSIVNSGRHDADFFKSMWKTIGQGKVWCGDICNKTKSGDEYWVRTTIVPFTNAKGRVVKYVSVRTDITNQVKAEAELRAANQRLYDTTAKLQLERTALNKKNIALHELISTVESEKTSALADVKAKFQDLVLPLLSQVKVHITPEKQELFAVFEQILRDFDKEILQDQSNYLSNLSPKEQQICGVLKEGMSNKEIASFFNISQRTVNKHCENIRKKLQIKDRKINLITYLRTH